MTSAAWARAIVLTTAAAVPILAWPGLERPFSTPKLWLIIASLIAPTPRRVVARARTAVHAASDRGRMGGGEPSPRGAWRMVHVLAIAWVASWTWSAWLGDVVSLDALLLALGTGLFAIVAIESAPAPRALAAAMVAGATGVAMVAVLQAVGLDPFALAGWIAPIAGASPRLRV